MRNDVPSRIVYTGNDSADEFNVASDAQDIIFRDNDDLVVMERDADGIATTLVLDTDYSIAGGPEDGIVTRLGGNLPLHHLLSIRRQSDISQETDFELSGDWLTARVVLTDTLDRMTEIMQEINDKAERALKLDYFDGTFDARSTRIINVADGEEAQDAVTYSQLQNAIIGEITGFDISGLVQLTQAQLVATSDLTIVRDVSASDHKSITPSAFVNAVIDGFADVATASFAPATQNLLLWDTATSIGKTVPSEALFAPTSYTTLAIADDAADWINVWDTSAGGVRKVLGQNLGFTQSGSGATLRGLQAKLRDDFISVKDFGAVGDNNTNDTPAIQAAIDAAAGRTIYFPRGIYRVDSGLTSVLPLHMVGDTSGGGPGTISVNNASMIICNFASGNVLTHTSNYPCVIDGISFNTTVAMRPRSGGAAIHITGPASSTNANSVVQNCVFSQQYIGVRLTRCALPRVINNYFEVWVNRGVLAETTAGFEGGGGLITGNYFFGTSGSTTQGACVQLSVGYAWVTQNLILGAQYGVQIAVAANPAGSIHINDNWIENQGLDSIIAQSSDGNACAMLHICRNEFSNVSHVTNYAASIGIFDYSSGTDWIDDILICDNVHRHIVDTNFKYIWIQSGRTVTVSREQFENLGTGSGTVGVSTTLAGAALKAPILIENCQFRGTFSAKYVLTSACKVVDHNGVTVAELPATIADGSFIYASDGTAGTVPVTGGGTGCFAERINGVWSTGSVADADVTALANNVTNGFWTRTGAGTGAARTLTAPAAGFTITNPAGTAGNPTFVLANDLAALEALSSTGFAARTTTDTWAQRTLTAPAAGFTITNPAGVAGDPTFVLANDLAALEGLGSTGFAARTTTDTWAQRTLTAPAAGFTITNPAGVAGNPTYVLANDLAALEGLASTGIARRTGTDTWSVGTTVSAAEGGTGVTTLAGEQQRLGAAIQLGKLVGANFNSTADQAITITCPTTDYMVAFFAVANASGSIASAIGGIYTAAAKGGVQVLNAATAWTQVTASGVNNAANGVMFAGNRNWLNLATLYLSLSTPHGSAATADVYVFGHPLY
jgi:hypothetical protein